MAFLDKAEVRRIVEYLFNFFLFDGMLSLKFVYNVLKPNYAPYSHPQCSMLCV